MTKNPDEFRVDQQIGALKHRIGAAKRSGGDVSEMKREIERLREQRQQQRQSGGQPVSGMTTKNTGRAAKDDDQER